ncbi:MAG: CHRD domain-containing protein [Nitrososphaeraceae archaeon]
MYITKKIQISLVVFALLFAASIITSNFIHSDFVPNLNVYAQQPQQQFIANLIGDAEVPPTNINSTGDATLKMSNNDQKEIQYSLNVMNLQGITEAHIHNGLEGVNGPVIVTLYKSPSPLSASNKSLAIDGRITATQLEGSLIGKPLTELLSLMNNGSTYVNVHTEQNPMGAIRGQIISEQVEANL